MIHGLALCAGVGGLELGLHLALGDAYRTVGYVERDAYAAAALVARMDDAALDRAPIWDDLTTFDGRSWRGRVDLVTTGFPCQPASTAGARRGVEDERWLWPYIADIIEAIAPPGVFLENVPGLLTVNDGLGFHELVSDLATLGFDLVWDVFSAAEVGAPHLRERLFLLAYASDRAHHGLQHLGQSRRERATAARDGGASVADPGDRDLSERTRPARRSTGEPTPERGESRGNREALADPEGLDGRLPVRERGPRQAGPESVGRGEAVADASGGGQSGEQHVLPGRSESDTHGGSEGVADADRLRHEGAGQPRHGRAGSEDRGGPLADADSTGWRSEAGSDGAGLSGVGEQDERGGGQLGGLALRRSEELGVGLGLFPPRPDDTDGWAAYLARAPHLEPAVRRGADGVARGLDFRVDRLRCAGNGVVSLAAAYAYCTLAARMRR